MKRLVVLAAVPLLLSCGTPRGNATVPDASDDVRTWSDERQEDAPRPPAPPPPSPDKIAGAFDSAHRCEQTARTLYEDSGPDDGWALLSACARRRDFTQLRQLLSPPWSQELRKRRGAAILVARTIAQRGGDIESDLRMVHRRRLPLFDLETAVTSPETYEGRLVLVRGTIEERRAIGEDHAVQVAETQVVGEVVHRKAHRQQTERDSIRSMNRHTAMRGSSGHERRARSRTVVSDLPMEDTVNVHRPTGRHLIARLKTDDPFLVPAGEYLFLLRFEGVREEPDVFDDEDLLAAPSDQGVGRLVAYFETSTILFE